MLNKQKKYITAMIVVVFVCAIILLLPYEEKLTDKEVEDEPYKLYSKVKPLIILTDEFKVFQTSHAVIENLLTGEIGPKDWNEIADIIFSNYNSYDCFIILQSPDTMCYTSSALAFILENLGKPVVLTTNLDEGLYFVNNYSIPEVVVVDSGVVYRGCRVKRFKGQFISPNFQPLGVLSDQKYILDDKVVLKQPVEGLKLLPLNPNKKVVIVKIFPGITIKYLQKILSQENLCAVILESYEDGILPNDPNFLKALSTAVEKGVILANVSQTSNTVTQDTFKDIGVISCGSMTTEAVYAKLLLFVSHVKNYNPEMVNKLLETGLRGDV
jgi:L-asparaginase/Glu-tRNA(Gln) amidotransferase subunit D